MNGSLNVESEMGKGSCFSISVPLSPKGMDGKEDQPTVAKKCFEILLINPQDDDLEKLRNMLIPRPFIKLSIAENGQQGIKRASGQKLIILGVQSEEDINILKQLKDNPTTATIPIVALTNKDQLKGLDSPTNSFFACLTYPINSIQLLATIESALEI